MSYLDFLNFLVSSYYVSHCNMYPGFSVDILIYLKCFQWLGPLGSRAAKAIGFIDMMIDYSFTNAPLQKELHAGNVITLQMLPF